jgi:hypothetical protein
VPPNELGRARISVALVGAPFPVGTDGVREAFPSGNAVCRRVRAATHNTIPLRPPAYAHANLIVCASTPTLTQLGPASQPVFHPPIALPASPSLSLSASIGCHRWVPLSLSSPVSKLTHSSLSFLSLQSRARGGIKNKGKERLAPPTSLHFCLLLTSPPTNKSS